MLRLRILWMVCACACSSHVDNKATSIEFGSAVAPPFGLVALRGGEPTQQAQLAIPRLKVASGSDQFALAGMPEGIEVRVMVDHGRIADVVIDIASCENLEGRLDKSWSTFQRGARIWSDPSTGWAADLVEKASGCTVRFTHAGYFGRAPTPFGAPADAKIGTHRDEAARIAPAVPSRVIIDAMEGVLIDRSETVAGQYYVLPRRAVEALRIAWGPGYRGLSPDTDAEHWLATEGHINAWLREVSEASNTFTLRLSGYVPLRDWLGNGPVIASLPDAIWSAPLPQLASAHRDLMVDEDAMTITLPSVEWSGADGTQADLHLDVHKVPQEVSVMLAYPNTQVRREMLDVFEAKWGKASEVHGRWSFARGPGVVLTDADGAWHLKITAPTT